MKALFVSIVALAIVFTANAQPFLKPHIGLTTQPSDSDSICPIPLYLGDFEDSGYEVGDTVNDFTLYNINGDSLRLLTSLQNNKPKLFISSSYTCPVFRNRIPQINDLVSLYGSYVDIYVVYTVEAHPDSNISPYFGYVAVNNQNIGDGILYHQPVTYGERESMVQDMLSDLAINAPVFVDGPCNAWWLNYGPAPNNATLIDANGIVAAKHGWFNLFPDNMGCDIDSLLGLSFTDCNSGNNNGSFTFTMISSDTVYGEAGTALSLEAELLNSSSEDVIVQIKRSDVNVPANWATALCLDVCYPATVDTTSILLEAGTTKSFHFYFFTDVAEGIGSAKIGFRNQEHINNAFSHYVYASTSMPTGLEELNANEKSLLFFPNPTGDMLHVSVTPVYIYDSIGKLIMVNNSHMVDVSDLSSGIYVLVCREEARLFVKR